MALTISAGVTHDVHGGGSETGDVVLSGGTLDVNFSGGGGTISATSVSSGGVENVFLGGTANATSVLSGGVEAIWNGGQAIDDDVFSGGAAVVLSGGFAADTTIFGGGNQFVQSDSEASGTIVSGGVEVVGGPLGSGGFASNTTVDAGHQVIGSGGVASDTAVSGGDELVGSGGESFDALITSSGLQVVEVGGDSEFATINGGVQIDFGDVFSATVNGGGVEVVWSTSGIATDTTINSGSFQFVVTGGSSFVNNINSGGTEFVVFGGFADNTFISGTQVISSALAEHTEVFRGGIQLVAGAGSADITEVSSGGRLFVESHGFVESMSLLGGQAFLFGGSASDGNISVGTEFIGSGGSSLADTVHSSGTQIVASGGFAFDADVEGGSQLISAGGSSLSSFVSAFGREVVSSGGTADSTFIGASGTLEIQSGGAADDGVSFNTSAGTLQLDDSQHFSGFISGFDKVPGNESDTNFLDLRDILYSPSGVTISWSQGSGKGTLTVGDGQGHTANLTLMGIFSAGDFHAESDGLGGTTIFDPSSTGPATGTTLATHTG